ncbi:MAG TPA: mechanosensitive ion channel family protein [Methylibium sp.]|nr:mechanosensitive ion channel family protein [Methylibium sp.]
MTPAELSDLVDALPPPLAAWLSTLGAAALAVLAAALLVRVGERLVQRATRGNPIAAAMARAVRNPARWALPLLALNLVWHEAPAELSGLATAQRLTGLLLIATLTWLLVRGINALAASVVAASPVGVPDNLAARRVHTQTKVLARTAVGMAVLIGASLMLMTFPAVRQIGTSLLASAGVVGIIAGFAARPVLGNLIAGLQIGLSQPIRLDDVVIVEGEWGVIEEITGTYVVVRIWDERRLVVPLQYWIEKPFQNWTRTTSALIGSVFLWVDYRMPLAPLRDALQRACASTEHWDGRLAMLQVTEAGEHALQLRCLVTAASAPRAWDLRCHVREFLIDFLRREYPDYLPRQRVEATLAHRGEGPERVPAVGAAD